MKKDVFPTYAVNLWSRALRRAGGALGLGLTCSLHAQFNAIGFEGSTIQNIPNAANVGVPTGSGSTFSYTFASGNNLQVFNNPSAGTVDSDDVGFSGAGSTSSVPDYYRSSEFLWTHIGFKVTPTDNTNPGWDTGFSTTYGNGAANTPVSGISYQSDGYANGDNNPGGSGVRASGTDNQYAEMFNINRNFSSTGNLSAAPGLGSQFLDTHLSPGMSSQFELYFSADQSRTFYTTLAFGGRDNTRGTNSANQRSYFRLYDVTAGASVISGDTTDTPNETWDCGNAGAVTTPVLVASDGSVGVTQTNWEYFRLNFAVVSGHSYKLQVMMANEINFDVVIGDTYNNIAGIVGGKIVAVPEASTYGLAGVGLAAGFALLRRRRARPTIAGG